MESEAFEDLEKGGGAMRTIKDLTAGALGGMAQVLLGMCAIPMEPELRLLCSWQFPKFSFF